MLQVDQLSANFGGIPALNEATLLLGAGEVVAVIGPNGAGKTTLLKAISGTVASTGRLTFEGQEIGGLPSYARSRLGITHVPQGRRVFPSLTVLENLEMGAYRLRSRKDRIELLDSVFELFPVLAGRRSAHGGHLSGGQQQMLAIGRGLMSRPKVLMLDEPSLGLAPVIVDEVFERVAEIHRLSGASILLVEQRAAEALEIASRGYVMEHGGVTMTGTTTELMANDAVRAAYVGV